MVGDGVISVVIVGGLRFEREYDDLRALLSAGPAEQKLLVELMVASSPSA